MRSNRLVRRLLERRRWLGFLGLVVLVLAVLGGIASLRLSRSGADLREAQDLVESAATAIQDGRLADARDALDQAQVIVVQANNDLYSSIELQLIGWVPVARENLDSIRDSVALAATVIDGGRRILSAATPLESPAGKLEVSLSDGTIPLEAVSLAGREISALSVQLPAAAPTGAPRFLTSQARELRSAVYEEAASRRAQLDVLGRGLSLMEELAGGNGPRRYLIAVSNTAEMRGSGGMVLNYGVLQGADGVIDLTAFGRIDELLLPQALATGAVELPEDYLKRWSGFEPTRRWRNANMSGDFTLVAPVLEAMYEQASGTKVDGVLQIDPEGLASILTGVGPVTVPEVGVVSADNVVPLVLSDAYRVFPGIEERSDVLGDVAEAAFTRLVDGEFPSLRPLATALVEAVDGRHVIFHSQTSAVDDAGSFFGAAGDLPPIEKLDYAHLTVQNVAGNKLDYYLDTTLSLTGARRAGELGSLQAEIVLTNTAPPGATDPRYIFGPFNDQQEAGLYRGIVTLYLPLGTRLVGSEGDAVRNQPVAQTEGGRPLVSYTVDVPAGQSRRLILDLRLTPLSADQAYELVLVPSPRVRPTTASVDIATDDGSAAGDAVLDTPMRFQPGRAPSATGSP